MKRHLSMAISGRLRIASGALTLAFLTGTWGCASGDPVARWQHRVTRYIEDEGHGNPAVLRDMADVRSPRIARPGQLVIGDLGGGGGRLGTSADVHGVFLGREVVDGQPWYLFLVGVVMMGPDDAPEASDVRLAAMATHGGRLIWKLTGSNPSALSAYRISQAAVSRQLGRRNLGRAFPGPLDQFDLRCERGQATVTETNSRAEWSIDLNDEPKLATRADEAAPSSPEGDTLTPHEASS